MMRVGPARLRQAAAANAANWPILAHQRMALAARAHGRNLTAGQLWFLDSVLRLPTISEPQFARLQEIAVGVELVR